MDTTTGATSGTKGIGETALLEFALAAAAVIPGAPPNEPDATAERVAPVALPSPDVHIPQEGSGRLNSACVCVRPKLVTVQMKVCMGRVEPGTQRDKEQKAMTKNVNSLPSMVRRIDDISASKTDRQTAKEGMQDAELVAELLCRAGTNLRFAGALLSKLLAQRAA